MGSIYVLTVHHLCESKTDIETLCFAICSDNVGELINNTAILEHNTASKSTCATFRNMVCSTPDLSHQIFFFFLSLVNQFYFWFNSPSRRSRERTERDQSLWQRRSLLSCSRQRSPSQGATHPTGYRFGPCPLFFKCFLLPVYKERCEFCIYGDDVFFLCHIAVKFDDTFDVLVNHSTAICVEFRGELRGHTPLNI